MILQAATYETFGYYPRDLEPKSSKKIVAVCDNCGEARAIAKNRYRTLCHSCTMKGAKNGRGKDGKKLSTARRNAKRKRQLNFIPVLSQNSGEVWHHFTNEYVIGIPEEAHNKCGGRRQRHRLLVLEWLRMHDRVKYQIIQSFKNTLAGW